MPKLPAGPLVQVRNFKKIRKNIISVETEQGIDVEDNRRDGRDKHHVVSQRM